MNFSRNYNQSEVDYVETCESKIFAYEMKWNVNKKKKVNAAFRNAYPDAITHVITPQNCAGFCD